MKLSLVYSTPSERYAMPWSLEKLNDPPQVGLAVLARSLEDKISGIEVKCIGNQIVSGDQIEDYDFNYRSNIDYIGNCKDSDFVGMSVSFTNLMKSLEVARELKKRNSLQKIVFGGPEVYYSPTAKMILEQEPAVDYIIAGDGEQSLVDLGNGIDLKNIPGLFYRANNKIIENKKNISFNQQELWDFKNTTNYEAILQAYDSRTQLYRQLRERYGNFIGKVGVQLSKGCEKAGKMGRCFFCVSVQHPKILVGEADKFWRQVLHLYDTHGITEYFITDNILAIPKKLDSLISAKETYEIPEEIQFRAYGYVPYFFQDDSHDIFDKLNTLNVKNLFIGVENFNKRINELSNKPGFEFSEVRQIVDGATKHGIDMFLPIMVGLPGDSKESLEFNLKCMEKLLSEFGSEIYGLGKLVRVDLSMAMPLRGTPWYNQLIRNKDLLDYYKSQTGVELYKHLDVDYDVLRAASLEYLHSNGLSKEDLSQFRRRFTKMCSRYIRPEQIGGFEPSVC